MGIPHFLKNRLKTIYSGLQERSKKNISNQNLEFGCHFEKVLLHASILFPTSFHESNALNSKSKEMLLKFNG
jgi:hypothetical protein